MKKAISFILLFIGHCAIAQNLVPNGSFEDSDPNCPFWYSQLETAQFWYNTNASPDLFAECASIPEIRVPSSQVGFQWAYEGSKYCHFGKSVNQVNGSEYSEGITVELSSPLSEGEYCLYFYYSTPEVPKFWIETLDISLSDTIPEVASTSLESLVADGHASGLQIDSQNWLEATAVVFAEDGDKFLTIGSFPELSNTDFIINNANSTFEYAGFFLDNISLVDCGFSLELLDTTICTSDSLILSVDHYNDIQYEWTYNGNIISDSSTLSMHFPQAGWYYLNYVNFRGDTFIDSLFVELTNCASFELPNVFTPNNDGNNDYWRPIAEDIDQIEILIYSRWGQQVFSYSGSYNDFIGWSPNDVPQGTYYVVVKAAVINGSTIEEKGSITLLR